MLQKDEHDPTLVMDTHKFTTLSLKILTFLTTHYGVHQTVSH